MLVYTKDNLIDNNNQLQWHHNEHDCVSNYQRLDCLLNRLFRHRSNKTSKLCVTGLYEGNSPVTGEFPAQRASNAEKASIWWRYHQFAKFNFQRLPSMVRISHFLFCIIRDHDNVIKWKHFRRCWSFVQEIHRWPVNSPHKGQWRGALMFSLICAWINGWVNHHEAGDLRRHRAHYDVIVMILQSNNRIKMNISFQDHWSIHDPFNTMTSIRCQLLDCWIYVNSGIGQYVMIQMVGDIKVLATHGSPDCQIITLTP